jgi:hypothetical protein
MGTTVKIPSSEYIDLNTASKKQYLNLGRRQIQNMCQQGLFKSAFKAGTQTKTSKWQILRSEVIAHRVNGHFHPDNY